MVDDVVFFLVKKPKTVLVKLIYKNFAGKNRTKESVDNYLKLKKDGATLA